ASSAAPPGPPAVSSACLGPSAVGSGLRWGQHQEMPGAAATGSTRGQNTGKGPPQSPVFEGVCNNSRMLHFLTAVVASTCDVKVKNGTTYEGICKMLSSNFELAKASETAGGPCREDTVDTMVFKPSDVMLVHFRNADFSYATKDKFTDSAIKVLQRWEGGDSNSDNYDLKSNTSNGWDPNEMFKFNEENYGVKTSYDSSLSPYTMPLEKDNSEEFQLSQYRLRISMESDDGRTEEEKHRVVQRQGSGQQSPSLASRKGKYIIHLSPLGGRPSLSDLPPRGPHHVDNSNPGPGSEARDINGGPSHMSPKAQRPLRGAKTLSSPNNRPSGETSVPPPAVGRMYPQSSPKFAAPAPVSPSCPEPPIGLAVPTSSASIPVTLSVSDPGMGSISTLYQEPGRTLEPKNFGAQFKLQPSSSPENSLDPFPSWTLKEEAKGKEKEADGLLTSEPMGSPVSSKTESVSNKEDKPPLAPEGDTEGPEMPPPPCPSQTGSPPLGPIAEQVKKSEFNPTKPLLSMNKSTSTPTSPGPWTHSALSIPVLTAGQSGLYSPQYMSCIPQIHMGPAVQAPQMYPYPVSNSMSGQQGKYWGAKGSLFPQLWDQHDPTVVAAGPPLVAAMPYSSYIPYNPQQFPGPPAMMQPMAHYSSRPVFAPMLQSNPRMLTSGSHPQVIMSSSTPQYPSAEQPTPQALYVTVHQAYPHYATQLHAHQPQPAITPTGNQPAAPSPVQHQAGVAPHLGSGQPQQNLHAALSATGTFFPVPSEQFPPASHCVCHQHQQLPHGFTNMAHVPQAHVQTGITAALPPHPGAPHLPQRSAQSGVPAFSASTSSPYPYIGHPQRAEPGSSGGGGFLLCPCLSPPSIALPSSHLFPCWTQKIFYFLLFIT
uniref:LsmAD domain-containing protein n=1 Tax=Nomascus leucogenys TaxID=61853 RepID=A0A2I3GXR7_NOMLE